MWIASIPGLSLAFLAFFLTLFVKEDLKRLKDDLNLNDDNNE